MARNFRRKPTHFHEVEFQTSSENLWDTEEKLKMLLNTLLWEERDYFPVVAAEKMTQQTIEWNIENFWTKKQDTDTTNKDFQSRIYAVCSKPCHMQFKLHVDPIRTNLDTFVRIYFMFIPNEAGILEDHVFDHEISYILRNSKGDVVISQTKEPGYGKVQRDRWESVWSGNRMFASAAVVERLRNGSENDSLRIEICIRNLIPLMVEAASYDGVLDWKIDNYSLKKKEEKEGMFESLVSEPFYTGQKGYRMRAELYLNGSLRHGTHVELQLRTLRGRYDDDLPRAFGHIRSVKIMPVDSRCEPIGHEDILDPVEMGEDEVELQMGESRKALLVSHTDMENDDYLCDDTLHIKILITPLQSLESSSFGQRQIVGRYGPDFITAD